MMPAESNNKNSAIGFDMSLTKFHFSGNSIFCTILADRTLEYEEQGRLRDGAWTFGLSI